MSDIQNKYQNNAEHTKVGDTQDILENIFNRKEDVSNISAFTDEVNINDIDEVKDGKEIPISITKMNKTQKEYEADVEDKKICKKISNDVFNKNDHKPDNSFAINEDTSTAVDVGGKDVSDVEEKKESLNDIKSISNIQKYFESRDKGQKVSDGQEITKNVSNNTKDKSTKSFIVNEDKEIKDVYIATDVKNKGVWNEQENTKIPNIIKNIVVIQNEGESVNEDTKINNIYEKCETGDIRSEDKFLKLYVIKEENKMKKESKIKIKAITGNYNKDNTKNKIINNNDFFTKKNMMKKLMDWVLDSSLCDGQNHPGNYLNSLSKRLTKKR